MKLLGLLLRVALAGAVPATAGCASTADGTATGEEMLVSHTRLDRVTPAEVAATYMTALGPDLALCVAGNPNIVNVDKGNLSAFYRPGNANYYDVNEVLAAMLAEPGVSSIPVAGLSEAIEAWVKGTLTKSVDGDGFYVRPKNAPMMFWTAEVAAREAKALSAAARPGGKNLADIRAEWRTIEMSSSSDTGWYNPVKVNGEPTLGDVKKLLDIRYTASLSYWGNEAVDEFQSRYEGSEFDAIASFMKSSAIKKRWMLFDGGDEWNHQWLVVLDDQNQLWGVSAGYSE